MEKNKKSAGERPGAFQILQKIIAEFLLNNNPPAPTYSSSTTKSK